MGILRDPEVLVLENRETRDWPHSRKVRQLVGRSMRELTLRNKIKVMIDDDELLFFTRERHVSVAKADLDGRLFILVEVGETKVDHTRKANVTIDIDFWPIRVKGERDFWGHCYLKEIVYVDE